MTSRQLENERIHRLSKAAASPFVHPLTTNYYQLRLLANPLFLHSLDLHDDAVLDNHADFTVSDPLNGLSNVIQVQFAERW